MTGIKQTALKAGLFLFIAVIIMYVIYLTVLPKFLSSHIFLDAIDEIIAEKTGIVIKSERLRVVTYPALVINISSDKISIKSEDNELLKVKNASFTFDLKTMKPKRADIDYIYLNQKHLDNIIKNHKNKKPRKLKLRKFPELNIKKTEIWLHNGEKNRIFIDIDNIKITNDRKKTKCEFKAEIISDLLINTVQIGKKGYLYIKGNKIYAENLNVLIGVSELTIDGKVIDSNKKNDFTIKGNDIPVSDVLAALLYFQKIKEPGKKFMDNFYDYGGKLHVDLKVTEKGIFGNCNAVKLSSKTVLFNAPVLFKNVPIKFEGNKFLGGAFGTIAGEKVYADFSLTDIASINQEAKGKVQAVLTNKSVGSYIPNTSVKGNLDVSVNWNIKNKNIDVNYNIFIPKNSDIFYQNANLGIDNKDRKLEVSTLKHNDKLKITDYNYSINDNGTNKKIIKGEGLFSKVNDKFNPDYITCKTENDAPVSIAGSFYKYIKDGVFNGNLKYNFNKNKITGTFNIKNSIYKDYLIKEAKVSADDNNVIIDAEGEYKNSLFSTNISGVNNFNGKIKINSLYLFLDELLINPAKNKNSAVKIDEKTIKEHTENFEIDIYKIKLNKLKYRKAILTNILIKGSIINNVFKFEVPNINFAQGILKANGFYDFNKRISDVIFYADNINSNIAAESLFNLPNQVQGRANGILKIKTKNGIEDKCGNIKFSIKNGYLPKLGSTEFIIKQSKIIKKPIKFTIQDAVNIDIKNMKALQSNIEGTFDINNGYISNTYITSSQKYLSLLLLGDYNIIKQHADIHLFGKYNNKEVSKIKIFFVPLSWIVKIMFKKEKTYDKYKKELNEVPDIQAENTENISAFRVKITGNINQHNAAKVEMKSIL